MESTLGLHGKICVWFRYWGGAELNPKEKKEKKEKKKGMDFRIETRKPTFSGLWKILREKRYL